MISIRFATASRQNLYYLSLFLYDNQEYLILQDQMRALDMIRSDPGLASLKVMQAELTDVEIRGVPALKFFGDMIWR